MLVKTIRALGFLCLLVVWMAVAPAVLTAQVEWNGGDPGDQDPEPGSESVTITGGQFLRIQDDGRMAPIPDGMHLWQCDDNRVAGIDEAYMNPSDTLQLGEEIGNCGEFPDYGCQELCDYGTVSAAFDWCGYRADHHDGAEVRFSLQPGVSPDLFWIQIDVCYLIDLPPMESGWLYLRIADADLAATGGPGYVHTDGHSVSVLDSESPLICDPGFRGHTFVLPDPLFEGSYNVQLSLWKEACGTGPTGIVNAGHRGGETENYVLRLGHGGAPDCTTPMAALTPYDPDFIHEYGPDPECWPAGAGSPPGE